MSSIIDSMRFILDRKLNLKLKLSKKIHIMYKLQGHVTFDDIS